MTATKLRDRTRTHTALALTPAPPTPVPRSTQPPNVTVIVVSVVPAAIPVEQQQVATATDTTATVTTSVLSMGSMGNPAVASQGSRLAVLRLAIECRERELSEAGTSDGLPAGPEGWDSHPLRFALSSLSDNENINLHGGAVIGNIVIVIAFGLGAAAVLALRSLLARTSVPRAMAWTRFPGCLTFPVAFLLQPVITSSTVLLFQAPGGAAKALGAMGMCLGVLVWCVGVALYARQFARHFAFEDAKETLREGRCKKIGGWFLSTAGEWAPHRLSRQRHLPGDASIATQQVLIETDAAPQSSGATTIQLRRFGMLFDPYGKQYPWFMAMEMGYLVAAGVAAGLQAAVGCVVAAWLGASFAVALFLAMAVLRPYARRLDGVIQAGLAGLQALGAVLAAVGTLVDDQDEAEWFSVTSDASVSAASVGATLLGVYELAKAVYEQLAARARRREKHAEESENFVSVDTPEHNVSEDRRSTDTLPAPRVERVVPTTASNKPTTVLQPAASTSHHHQQLRPAAPLSMLSMFPDSATMEGLIQAGARPLLEGPVRQYDRAADGDLDDVAGSRYAAPTSRTTALPLSTNRRLAVSRPVPARGNPTANFALDDLLGDPLSAGATAKRRNGDDLDDALDALLSNPAADRYAML
jgi:hypothetical protein